MGPIQKIKVSLKPFLKGTSEPALIIKRIKEVHHELVSIKMAYDQEYTLNKCIVFHSQKADIPHWSSILLPSLQEYLDVQMYQTGYILENRIEPSKTIMVLGSKDQTLLARHYLNFIIPSIDAYTNEHRRSLERKAKKIRQEIRDGKKDKSQRMDDIRRLTSEYRTNLIHDIKSGLEELLDHHRENDSMAYLKGFERREQIKNKLSAKGIKL